MKLSKLMMAFAMCAVTLTGTAQTKVIAHRGYWKCEGSAQNSIASLTKAAEAKVYGSEFDVQLTKDKEIVVLSLIHISEPTRQAEISYAVFCLKKKKKKKRKTNLI